MKRSQVPTYFHWRYFHSWSEKSPNMLKFKVIDVHPSPEKYATTVKVNFYNNGIWYKKILPLWNYNSNNPELLEEWEQNLQSGKIKKGKEFILKTWLKYSVNGKTLRKFHLEF